MKKEEDEKGLLLGKMTESLCLGTSKVSARTSRKGRLEVR
jgi:hypothetical protein